MKILVVGKPVYNTILTVENYPEENLKYNAVEKLNLGGGASLYAATLLGKWNMQVGYSGMIGSDDAGKEIKQQLDKYNVGTKLLEINYEHSTNKSYIIINKQNGSSTELSNINHEVNVKKFKYDFKPDYILLDGSDEDGSLAALNNHPDAKVILFANKVSESLYNLSKKCDYVVANKDYAEALTKLKLDQKSKNLVNFMQKIKDFNRANHVVMMRDKGVLYVSDNQVKMMPAININSIVDDTHSGFIFFGAFAYGIINNYNIDDAVKLANVSAGLSLTKLGSENALVELNDVLDLSGIKPKAEIETLDI